MAIFCTNHVPTTGPRTTTVTKAVQAFDKAELANLLHMCLESWQDQYDLTQDWLPQSVRKLLGILDNVKKVVANSNAKEMATKESTEKATGKGKRSVQIPTNFKFPRR
jgi:hypothetical protein